MALQCRFRFQDGNHIPQCLTSHRPYLSHCQQMSSLHPGWAYSLNVRTHPSHHAHHLEQRPLTCTTTYIAIKIIFNVLFTWVRILLKKTAEEWKNKNKHRAHQNRMELGVYKALYHFKHFGCSVIRIVTSELSPSTSKDV